MKSRYIFSSFKWNDIHSQNSKNGKDSILYSSELISREQIAYDEQEQEEEQEEAGRAEKVS